jgi:hypothetical protein
MYRSLFGSRLVSALTIFPTSYLPIMASSRSDPEVRVTVEYKPFNPKNDSGGTYLIRKASSSKASRAIPYVPAKSKGASGRFGCPCDGCRLPGPGSRVPLPMSGGGAFAEHRRPRVVNFVSNGGSLVQLTMQPLGGTGAMAVQG